MAVNFNPNLDFSAVKPIIQPQQTKPVSEPVKDVVEIKEKPVKNKKKAGGFRNTISNIAKFFTTLGTMTKAFFKGLGFGALTAGTVYAGFWSFGSVPQAVKEKSMQALKTVSKKGKVISIIAGIGVLTYHMIKGKLQANQKTANVDHQLKTGHDENSF